MPPIAAVLLVRSRNGLESLFENHIFNSWYTLSHGVRIAQHHLVRGLNGMFTDARYLPAPFIRVHTITVESIQVTTIFPLALLFVLDNLKTLFRLVISEPLFLCRFHGVPQIQDPGPGYHTN